MPYDAITYRLLCPFMFKISQPFQVTLIHYKFMFLSMLEWRIFQKNSSQIAHALFIDFFYHCYLCGKIETERWLHDYVIKSRIIAWLTWWAVSCHQDRIVPLQLLPNKGKLLPHACSCVILLKFLLLEASFNYL